MDLLGNLQTTLAALAGIAGVIFAFWRWARPRWKRVGRDLRAGRDALVGREEIVDSITGRVLVPALPGMGVRMDSTEQNLAKLSEAFSTLAKTHVQLDDHESRLKALEDDRVERVVNRVDSIAAWRAVEAAHTSQPQDETLPGVGEN